MSWFALIVGIVGALALTVVGAVLVRPAHAKAGLLLAIGGVLALCTTCCLGVVPTSAGEVGGETLVSVALALTSLVDLAVVGLVAGGLAVLAKALRP